MVEVAVREKQRPNQHGSAAGADHPELGRSGEGEGSRTRSTLTNAATEIRHAEHPAPGERSGEAVALNRGYIDFSPPMTSNATEKGVLAPKGSRSGSLDLSDNPYESRNTAGALEFKKEREELLSNIHHSSTLDDRTKGKMLKAMSGFERRAAREHIDQSHVTETYHGLNEMLTLGDKAATTPAEQQLAVAGFLDRLRNPTKTDRQGHDTCQSTQLTTEQIKNHPEAATQRLLAIMKQGYSQPGGNLDADNIRPDIDALEERAGNSGARNYASQLLDNDLINSGFWNERGLKYTRSSQDSLSPGDKGYRLRDLKTGEIIPNPDGTEVDSPGLDADAVAGIAKKIGLPDDLIRTNKAFDRNSHVAKFGSKEELYDALKSGDKLLAFHSGHRILNGDGEAGGGHLARLSLVDGDGNPCPKGYAYLGNSWGANSDKLVRLEDAYEATLPPDQWTNSGRYGDPSRLASATERRASGQWYAPNIVPQGQFENEIRGYQDQLAGRGAFADRTDPTSKDRAPRNEDDERRELLARREKKKKKISSKKAKKNKTNDWHNKRDRCNQISSRD